MEHSTARLARALVECGLIGHAAELDDILAAPADAFVSPAAMFDAAYYRAQLPAALAREVNPLRHYLEIGAPAMLSPHPCFDLEWLEGAAALPPIIPILEAREAPYATPNLLFEPERYAAGIALGPLPPFEHFLRHWPDNQAEFSRFFDVTFYARRNPHLARARINPLVHYFTQPPAQRHDEPDDPGQIYRGHLSACAGRPVAVFYPHRVAGGLLAQPICRFRAAAEADRAFARGVPAADGGVCKQ